MVGKRRVLIVGAGPNGLPAIRWGKLYDVDVICFEASDKIGGLWRYKSTETDESSVMKSTVINTSKELCSYSDFPPEPEMANYMHNTEMLRYFQMYAEHYDLIKHIKFEHKVGNIERASNYETTGRWTVKYTDNNGEEKHDTFDGVLLCTGHHQFPNIPHFEGQEKFNGKIIHSHSYKDHRGYEDKVIVCVGVGNSGVDVAVEMSRVGKQVYLSTRKGTWLFNRVYDYGLPMDQTINCRVVDFARKIVPGSIINYVLERKLNQRFNHELYGLKPKHRLFSAHPTINDELPNRIISGTVRVKPDIKRFTETGVVFEDGSEVEHVDEVILSTGYKFHMNLLESGNVISIKNNRVGFYKYMFPPEFSDHNTFAVIGLMQTVGAIMPAGEMQIRLFYEVFSGGVKLPSREEMEKDVQKKIKANADRYVDSLRHTIQVDFVPFMDELAEAIGCDVKLWEIFKQGPSLAYKVFFGPNSSYIYRLRGPHPWEGAKQAIEGIMPRTLKMSSMKGNKKKVLVVGAGASGLPSIRWALLYDLDVVCFEGSDDIGGLWRYKPMETEESSVMKSTIINSSKEMSAYSDFPPEDTMANYMHNTEMYRYFKMYAEHYDLLKYIKFHYVVKNVERAPDYKTTGKWNVSYVDNEGKEKSEAFDGVLLCNGHHQFPYMPKFEGQEKFKGRIIHSHSYKDHKGYEDKVCVCVGVGNSGIDVAVELSRVAKQAYLVSRRGTWVLNRVFDYGMPLDQENNNRFRNDVLRRIVPPSVTNWFIESKLNQRFDHALYGLKPKHRIFEAHPTVNDELPNRIISGTVRVKPNIKRFTESGVIFEDGTEVDHVDEVILSTGYKFHFTLVEGGKLIPVKDNEVSLFEFMFPLETADHNSLAIIGLIQPLGSIMPISEMQARVFFENLTGGRKLPSKVEMGQNIKCKKMAMEARYIKSPRHTIQVDYIPYMDELAKMAGCEVDLWDEFKKDPIFAYKIFCGPNVPYVYRLRGPHAWSGAKKTIEGVEYRTKLATCGSKMKVMESHCACHNMMMTAVSIIAALILAVILYRIF